VKDLYDTWGSVTAEPTEVSYRSDVVNGIPAVWVIPENAEPGRVLLFAHGGGHVAGSTVSHRKLSGHIAKAAGATGIVFDYRLSPEHPFPASQTEDCRGVYDHLLELGHEPSDIGLVGDSAGGALVTLLALELRDAGLAVPAAVVALSPMLDLEVAGESFITNAALDLIAERETAKGLAKSLLGDASPTDPSVNPLHASAAGLPPFFFSVGGYEALLDDSTRYAEALRAAGSEVEIEIVPEMQHVFQFLAGRAPEADESIARIGEFLRTRLSRA
jgi:acetyl esterase/lipase